VKSSDLNGYIERGLDADLARWFPDAAKVQVAATVQPVGPFLQTLPTRASSALRELDEKVRSGTMPSVWLLEMVGDASYGFDFVAKGAKVLDEEQDNIAKNVWSLGCDGRGNYYVLKQDGRVATWYPTDGDKLDANAQFASLDAFMWAKVRRAAVNAKKLTQAELDADLASLADPGVASLFSKSKSES